MEINLEYKQKYLDYKIKYLNLKHTQYGGAFVLNSLVPKHLTASQPPKHLTAPQPFKCTVPNPEALQLLVICVDILSSQRDGNVLSLSEYALSKYIAAMSKINKYITKRGYTAKL